MTAPAVTAAAVSWPGAGDRPVVRPGAPLGQSGGRRAWGAIWRTLVAAFFGLMGLAAVAWQEELGERAVLPGALAALDLFLGLLSLGLMHLRRRWPFTTALVLTCFMAGSTFAMGAAAVAIVSLATTRRWLAIGIVGVVHVVAYGVYLMVFPYVSDPLWNGLFDVGVGGGMYYVLLVTIGAYIGLRRDHVRSLVLRAETAEREQAGRVAQARSNERARIAREMHDVLAHRISLVAMHAGGLAYRKDLPRQEVTSTAETIRDSAHAAMQELREILGVLRDLPEGGAVIGREGDDVHRPQPTLEALPALLDECRSAGVDVTFHDDRATESDGTAPDVVPGGHVAEGFAAGGGLAEAGSRTAYRIVQEALTNARKHAPGKPVVVTIAGAPGDGIDITVANPLPHGEARDELPASGLGLMGLTERAELGGGRLGYGTEGGRFVVRAWLPWAES
ncbi:sensor histidine kinase [Myceligenerans xiligouense]|uniref:histidine kinase n=1 Tax=Myceligenerans xiligouense TaxID=253184 RepID=A0A3N4ZSG8_9MICO|nr:histidine kinase [Myceligenerans xiligouense]RPF22691.1 signal transduction histidine kinase [Myceligenerans xiligouense]